MSDLFDDSNEPSLPYSWQHLPFGYELVTTPNDIRLYGPFSTDLADALHGVGGHWEPDLLAYSMPLGRQPQIDQALKKYTQSQDEFASVMAKLAAHSGPNEQQREQQRRQNAVANRLKVVVGQYQPGDRLKGRTILDFGRPWQEFPGLEWHLHHKGKCLQCHKYRGLSGTNVCQTCSAEQQGLTAMTYCYAYFD
ncbi:MAG: hypothetical protein GY881_04835 [Gammaproteobacteria bacterium]|nr:hypothetical protein [Gammaproteobacteria bacterium]MCP4879755.1 hypothetical protein [Gammaproteobacteria bacterium]